MNVIRFTIEGRLPGLNELISSHGRPWWACRRVKEDAMKVVQWNLVKAGVPVFKKPISLKIKWIERDGRRDRDNVSGGGTKILLDAMQQEGIIQNDSRKWVADIQHDTREIDKAHPRVEIEITEAA